MSLVLQTPRLRLRRLRDDAADAAAMLELLNESGYHRSIGDRGVRTLDQARDFIGERALASYELHGFGMYAIERRADGSWLGNAGLVSRAGMAHADIGYALLARHAGQGYALEAARGVLGHARQELGMERLCALVAAQNARSISLLGQLGMQPCGSVRLPGIAHAVRVFATA